MSQTVLLGDLIKDIAMGPFGSNLKVDSFTESGVPVIKGGNLYEYEVGGDFSFVSEEKALSLKRSLAYPDDIVITHRGTLGQVSIVPSSPYPYYLTSQSQLRLTLDQEKVLPRYLLYYLRSRLGQNELMQHVSQVGVPSIATPTKAVKSFRVVLPDLETQRKIVDMLGAIDEKIELNRRMNETLEQIGLNLFSNFFRNSKSGRWKQGRLNELIDVNVESLGKDYAGGDILYVDIASVGHGFIEKTELINFKSAPSRARRVVHDGDIIWATVRPNRRTFSLIMDPPSNLIVSTGFAVVRPRQHALGYVYYHMCSPAFTNYLMLRARGAAYPVVTAADFREEPVLIPDETTLEAFNKLVLPNMKLIQKMNQETQALAALRDRLLPRLISGRLEV